MTQPTNETPSRRAVLRALGAAALVSATAGCARRSANGVEVAASAGGRPGSSGGHGAAGGSSSGAAWSAHSEPHRTQSAESRPNPPPKKSAPPPSVKRGSLLAAGTTRGAEGLRHYLSIVDLDQPKLRAAPIETHFYGHGLAFDPHAPHRVILFEKHGPGACEIDLAAGKVLRKIPTTKDRQFYGHGVFTVDGALLLATETVVSDGSKRGVIVVRDGHTLAPQGTFPSFGEAPHDCRLVDGGKTLVVTNGGGSLKSGHVPNIAYIDVATRKLKERVSFDSPRVNAGHLAISRAGDLVVVSAPRDGLDLKAPDVHGAISFRPRGSKGPLKSPANGLLAKMRAETLSVAIHEGIGVVAATSPAADLVSFWDVKTGKLMSTLDSFSQPRGITVALDGSCFALTYGVTASLALIDVRTLQPMPGGLLTRAWMSGSHVYAHPLARG